MSSAFVGSEDKVIVICPMYLSRLHPAGFHLDFRLSPVRIKVHVAFSLFTEKDGLWLAKRVLRLLIVRIR